jgi:DNA-binding beta-propeller fold protein YncE
MVIRVSERGPPKAITIVNHRSPTSPTPIAIAATARYVWVLNGNTATVSVIDVEQRAVVHTLDIGIDRAPTGIVASGDVIWVSNGDGTLSRIASVEGEPTSVWVGESLSGVVVADGGLWVTTRALDKAIPGGES